jgi:hypothetical protein
MIAIDIQCKQIGAKRYRLLYIGRLEAAGLAPKSMILSDSQVHSSGFAAGKGLLGER